MLQKGRKKSLLFCDFSKIMCVCVTIKCCQNIAAFHTHILSVYGQFYSFIAMDMHAFVDTDQMSSMNDAPIYLCLTWIRLRMDAL